ncbi:ankyrin-3-like [Penaeus indicus]|uniref:ankyrin-3-like n=1 Tax=Penaeus indicus TaxID=29960 RepID=UPI00300D3A4D
MDPESRTKNLHLYLAILLGDVEELQECIASGADVAVADKFGDTFLHYVAKLGHCRVARVLLEAGVDPNASNGAGQTPLHYAARAGNKKIIRILLRNGAHMRVLDQGSYTPLHIASQRQRDKAACLLYRNKTTKTKIYRPKRQNIMIDCDLFHKLNAIVATAERTTVLDFLGMKDIHTAVTDGEIDRVKKLLEKRENVHSKSHDLSTPLHFSASGESTDIVKLLLEKGANPDAENETGDTPLHLAAISGKIEVLPLLATAANINKSSATHDKLIHYARYGGENPEQAMLDVSHLSSDGNTPLHFACLAGHIEAVNILLEKGADPKCTAESGHTPLHYASLRGHTKIVQKLIEVGVDVNALDRHRCTALHYAASAGHTSVVEELARSGTNLQLFTDAGKSVLHDASFYGRLDSAQRLAEIQPDLIAVRDKLALSAEDTAHIRGHAQAAWWLQKQTEAETTHETFNHRTVRTLFLHLQPFTFAMWKSRKQRFMSRRLGRLLYVLVISVAAQRTA